MVVGTNKHDNSVCCLRTLHWCSAPEGKLQCLTMSMYVSVCPLQALFICTFKLRYEQLYYGIPLIFIKLLHSEAIMSFAYHYSF